VYLLPSVLLYIDITTTQPQPPPSIPIIPASNQINPVRPQNRPNRPVTIPILSMGAGQPQPGTNNWNRASGQTRPVSNEVKINCINMGRDVVTRCFQVCQNYPFLINFRLGLML